MRHGRLFGIPGEFAPSHRGSPFQTIFGKRGKPVISSAVTDQHTTHAVKTTIPAIIKLVTYSCYILNIYNKLLTLFLLPLF